MRTRTELPDPEGSRGAASEREGAEKPWRVRPCLLGTPREWDADEAASKVAVAAAAVLRWAAASLARSSISKIPSYVRLAVRSARVRCHCSSIASARTTVRATPSHRSIYSPAPIPRPPAHLFFGLRSQSAASGARGFMGLLPNKLGLVPPLSDDFYEKVQLGPAALGPAFNAAEPTGAQPTGGNNTDKFYQTQYRCAACGTTISGHISFVEHCRGKAHVRSAGHVGFAGLLPNDAGFIPPLPPHIAEQIGAQPGPQENAAIVGRPPPPPPPAPPAAAAAVDVSAGEGMPGFAQAAAAAAAAMKGDAAAAAAAPAAAEKPKAHSVRMDHASLRALENAARAHDMDSTKPSSTREAVQREGVAAEPPAAGPCRSGASA